MKINRIGVNTAGMMPTVRDMQENGDQIQSADDLFGPEYEVTISEEGRKLMENQTEPDIRGGVRNDEELEMLFRQLEETKKARRERDGYKEELEELEKQIKVMNAAYGRVREDKSYDDPRMKNVVEQQQMLQEEMQEQKDFQEEEGLRRLREAQQMAAVQASQSREEIDENNRDLVTILRTMEEAGKAEDNRKKDSSKEDDDNVSDTGDSASDAIRHSAAGFMKSSLQHERNVEELSNMVGDSGRSFLFQADEIAQNLLKKGRFIKEAIEDESFTNGQIKEMLEIFRGEVRVKCEEAYLPGSFGTQVLRDMRGVKIRHIMDNPLQEMQQVKEGMMQAAADAAFGEARNGSLDETSKELAEEVEELIDERNGIDRTPEEKKEEEREKMQEKLMHPGEEKEEQQGAII
jgi:hypothetical protein